MSGGDSECSPTKIPAGTTLLDPEDEWEEKSFDETGFEETEEWDVDTFVDDIEQSLSNEEDFPNETEDVLPDEIEEGLDEGEGVGEAEDPELDETYDPWTEDDHRQQHIRRGSENSSNRGLYEAERSYANFTESAAPSPEDGMGLLLPRLTAFDDEDREPMFCKPLSEEEERAQFIEEVERFVADVETDEDDWQDSDAEPRLTDYTERILAKSEQMTADYFDDGAEERHYARGREDQHYHGSPDYKFYHLHRELRDKLEFYEDRGEEENVRFVYGAAKAVERARGIYADRVRKRKEIQEKYECGELTDLEFDDNLTAIEGITQKKLTSNELGAIGGGASFGEIGDVMDQQNNLLDDVHAANEEQMQHARNWIGKVPREVAERCISDAVRDGVLSHAQANHLMTMAARPTYSTSQRPIAGPKKKKKWFGW